jgi:hypothetical protein
MWTPHSKIRLTPKTRKGKNRIAQWGHVWLVKETMRGRALVEAETDPTRGNPLFLADSVRWINKQNDPDFGVDKS